jgi:hypothetical protein
MATTTVLAKLQAMLMIKAALPHGDPTNKLTPAAEIEQMVVEVSPAAYIAARAYGLAALRLLGSLR